MSEERQTLREVASGKIEIIWNGVFSRVEMNCSCLDALPLCHGMCCKNRSGYAVELEQDEIYFYQHRWHPTRDVAILSVKEDGSSCIYFDDKKGMCTIHERRPRMCRRWHCSSGGQIDDKEIERRDAGWMLLPVRAEEAELVRNQK